MEVIDKQKLYDLLELMVVCTQYKTKNTLQELNEQYEIEINKMSLPKRNRNNYIQEYDLLRNSCVCSISPMFENLKEKFIQDAIKRFSRLAKP